jgi:molecular chaperone DnaK
MKLGEAMYAAQSGGEAGDAAEAGGGHDDVVDAEFEEVDDDEPKPARRDKTPHGEP